jgi:asparagine synthase (glutamine-hydrolysing)
MCGIIGMLGPRSEETEVRFLKALDSIRHRGPNSTGVWKSEIVILGHQRLSIIELSDLGFQPMVDAQSGNVIVFNGEIYNYLELRGQLERRGRRFLTNSDTEVLLYGISDIGIDFMAQCNGMWALALWDNRSQVLTLSRDRFGKKPLYYAMRDQGFIFASEPKSLIAFDPSLADPDPVSLVDLVVRSRAHVGQRTYFKNISSVPAAHNMIFDCAKRSMQIRRYWDYPNLDECDDQVVDHSLKFASLFEDSIRIRLRSDVQTGITLSGGLDSSAVLAGANNVGKYNVPCLTASYDNHGGEVSWANLAVQSSSADLLTVTSETRNWENLLHKVVRAMDGPGFSPAVLPMWEICRVARERNILVLLEGQGADELFGGYVQHSAMIGIMKFQSGDVLKGILDFNRQRRAFGGYNLLAWMARLVLHAAYGEIKNNPRRNLFHRQLIVDSDHREPDPTLSSVGQSYDPLRKLLWFDHSQNVLPPLLQYGDAISMAHGVEVRLPFLDYRLVEWVFKNRIPFHENGRSKSLIRSYLEKNRLQRIAERVDKQGFNTPFFKSARSNGQSYLQDILCDASSPLWDFVDRSHLRRLCTQADRGSGYAQFHAYKFITIDVWLRQLAESRSICRWGSNIL